MSTPAIEHVKRGLSREFDASPVAHALAEITPPQYPCPHPHASLTPLPPTKIPAQSAHFPASSPTKVHGPVDNPPYEELTAFFRLKTASICDNVFTPGKTVSTPTRGMRSNAGRVSYGAHATPGIPAPGAMKLNGEGGHVRQKVAMARFQSRNAERYHEPVATLSYDSSVGLLHAAAGFVEDASGLVDISRDGELVLDLGTRATRGPMPYSIILWLDAQAKGRVFSHCVRDETHGSFVTTMSPNRGIDVAKPANEGEPVLLYFWAAPTMDGTDGGKVRATVEVRVNEVRLRLVLLMKGTRARFDVTADEATPSEKHSKLIFGKGESSGERIVTVRNLTKDDAPLLLSVVLEDSAFGAFRVVEGHSDEDGEATLERDADEGKGDDCVLLLEGKSSFSFAVTFDADRTGSEDTRQSFDYSSALVSPSGVSSPISPRTPSRTTIYGTVKIVLPSFVPGSRARSVDKDLLHYYDHVVDLERPGREVSTEGAIAPPGQVTPDASEDSQRDIHEEEGGENFENPSQFEGQGPQGELFAVDEDQYDEDYDDHDNDQCRDLGELGCSGALSVDMDNGDRSRDNMSTFDFSKDIDVRGLDCVDENVPDTEFGQSQSTNSMLKHFGFEEPLSELARFPDSEAEQIDRTISACLPLPGVGAEDGNQPSDATLTNPRLRLPKSLARDGMCVLHASEITRDVPVRNPNEFSLRISASLSSRARRTARIDLALAPQDGVIGPGEVLVMKLYRTGRGASCVDRLSIRCTPISSTGTCFGTSAKYRIPIEVQELREHDPPLIPHGFATDRPSLAFYGCTEVCTEGTVKMAGLIRVFNGSSESAKFGARIENVKSFLPHQSARLACFTDPNSGMRSDQEPFTIVGEAPDLIAPRAFSEVTVLFCAPTDESYYSGELVFSAGSTEDHRIPLFGYGGSCNINLSVEERTREDVDEGFTRCLISNSGSRTGHVSLNLYGYEKEEVFTLPPGEGVEVPIVLPGYDETQTSGLRCVGRVCARDSILESRLNYFVNNQTDGDNYDWSNVHASGSAFHYDERVHEFFGLHSSLIHFNMDIEQLTVEKDDELDADSCRPPDNFYARYCRTTTSEGGPAVGDRIFIYNCDARIPLEFSARGTEPSRGKVPPLGEAMLHVCGADVVVQAPGRGRTVIRLEDMPDM